MNSEQLKLVPTDTLLTVLKEMDLELENKSPLSAPNGYVLYERSNLWNDFILVRRELKDRGAYPGTIN